MRIRARLLILSLSILIPALLAGAFATWYVYKEQQKAQKVSLTEAARALSLLIDNELDTREGVLRTLARSPVLQKGDFESFYHYAKSVAPGNSHVVVLTDLAGRQLLNTRMPYGTTSFPEGGPNLGEIRRIHTPEDTIVSDLYFSPTGKRFSFAVQVPVFKDNQIVYYLGMGAFADHMQATLKRQQLPAQWIGTLVDRKGNVVARTVEPDKYIGKRVNEKLYKRIRTDNEGLHYGVTIEGIPTAAFFSRVPKSEWTMVINVPTSEMHRSATQAATFLAAIMAALLIMAVLFAHFAAKRIVMPIEALRRAAERLGKGEVVAPASSGLVEMESVNSALVDASNELRRSRTELEQRVTEAVASSEQAQRALMQAQKLEALGKLTGGIAHDFNNLLQTLTTALQLAQMTSHEPRVLSLLETCQKAVDRATDLTGRLRSFGRVQDARLQTIALSEHIPNITQLLRTTLPKNIDFQVAVDKPVWPVTVDPLQLELALLNITINARDAMPAGGQVLLEVRNRDIQKPPEGIAPGPYVCISVQDNGSGMAPEVLSKALDPFFTTKPVGQGTGLGLPQAYGFAAQSGGTLLIDSKLAAGTTGTIFLPRAKEQLVPLSPYAQPDRRLAGSGVVLFVDDDPLVREAVSPALQQTGFEVLVAKDGEEAIDLLQSGKKIDSIFSDIIMPGRVSGIDLARYARKTFPQIRVVLATGYSDNRVDVPDVRLLAKPYQIADAIQALSPSEQD